MTIKEPKAYCRALQLLGVHVIWNYKVLPRTASTVGGKALVMGNLILASRVRSTTQEAQAQGLSISVRYVSPMTRRRSKHENVNYKYRYGSGPNIQYILCRLVKYRA
jgi:hypothetical protein